jgi:ATP-dependent RNA helicase DDX24/MAK5
MKRQVDANALPWKTVEAPEIFDDAEGFYGLEEVNGVDVIRQGESVKFVRSFSPIRATLRSRYSF